MTISKGSPYGEPGVRLPDDGVRCASDPAARRVVEEALGRGDPLPVLGLLAGDLARTLGGHGELTVAYPADLGEVRVDGRTHHFVAHCVVRTRTWSRVIAAGNAQWVGEWNVWPKGHPNDGRLDVLDAALGPGQRVQAWRRLPTGTHLPHPGIRVTRTAATVIDLGRPMAVRCDGEIVDRGTTIELRVQPDALRVVA